MRGRRPLVNVIAELLTLCNYNGLPVEAAQNYFRMMVVKENMNKQDTNE